MKPRLSVLTLCVDDLERAVRFYRALGLYTPGIIGREFEHGAVAFFDLQPGLKLAVWPRTSLAHDSGLPPDRPGGDGTSRRGGLHSATRPLRPRGPRRRGGADPR